MKPRLVRSQSAYGGYPGGRLGSRGVTGNSEQEQAAELAMQVEAMLSQGMPIFRHVQQYLHGTLATETGVAAAARQVGKAMDLGMAEVIVAAQKLMPWPGAGLAGTAANASIAAGDFAAITENASVVRLDNLSELSSRASRQGIAGLTTMQVLALVLIWLLAVGVPVIQQALPPEAQALLSDENGTISLAFAITLVILSRRP